MSLVREEVEAKERKKKDIFNPVVETKPPISTEMNGIWGEI